MKLLFLLGFLLLALTRAAIEEEDGVLVLNEDNFDEATEAHDSMLVEFYAPWCGHCKSLAPEWAKAAKTLSSSPVKLAKVDCTVNNGLAKTYGIKGFPTIKFLRDGKVMDYNGGRTESEIVTWVNKKSGPATTTIATEDDLLKFQEKNTAFVLGVFSSVDSDAAKKFSKFASGDELHTFAITTAAAVKSKLAVTEDTIVVMKSFDDLRSDMSVSSGFTDEELGEFIVGSSTPLIQTFSQEAAKTIFSSPIQKHVLFFTDDSADYHAATVEEYTKVAKDFKGKTLVVNVPASESRVVDFFGITPDMLPTMIIADMSGESSQIKKYPYTGENKHGEIKEFVQSFFDGKLKPTLKSEKPAPEDTQGNVVVLKGESFADIVLNNDKDVLVEFYAPWCGHCKKLAPIWDALGDKMASFENIVIAKMDATANEIDVPGVSVKGFPSILFFKGNNKSVPEKYESGRELEDFVDFLQKNAHNSFEHEEL